ncbi:MAG: redoxin domain-containing protein [Isosphaeraceae bacterium]
MLRSPLFWILAIPATLAAALLGYARLHKDDRPREEGFAILVDAESHKVTEAMQAAADEAAGAPAPAFRSLDGDRDEHDLGAADYQGKPVVLIFIKDGCPCSLAMQPFFNQLARSYGDKIRFLGVIDGEPELAKFWGNARAVPYPILADPDMDIIRDYGVSNSAYLALIDPEHRLEMLWPGVSKAMLGEVNRRLAQVAGRAPGAIDTADAPSELYSGCPYNLD